MISLIASDNIRNHMLSLQFPVAVQHREPTETQAFSVTWLKEETHSQVWIWGMQQSLHQELSS